MPVRGVYPMDSDMYYVLLEYYEPLSDTDVSYAVVSAPLGVIVEDIEKGTSHPLILRERFRAWQKFANEVANVGDAISWCDLKESLVYDEDPLDDALRSSTPSWTLIGDPGIIDEALSQISARRCRQEDIIKVLIVADVVDLFLIDWRSGEIYIIKSSTVSSCVPLADGLADALVQGEELCYALPEDVLADYVQLAEASHDDVYV